jgi:UDP:flavonoid glycosyltransferase YjiC (YdhE family)
MARFLFTTWDGAGNQPPAMALARAIEKRGHHVIFAGYENQRRTFADRGFRFVLLERSTAQWRNEPANNMFGIKLRAAWASADHLQELPELMARQRCDVAVVDCLMFGALAAAEKMRLPAVALVHSAPGALMPPKGAFEALLLGPVNEVRKKAGLAAVDNLWETWARFPTLSNSVRELDPLSAQAPRSFHYLGPLADDTARSAWKSPWSENDTRPLVLVSFSTGPYWDQTSRVTRTLEALADIECRILVTAGRVDIDQRAVPGNAMVVKHAPHDQILPATALTVTHGGHGTVIASLKHGVPLLCLPNPVADQPILAQRVQALRCGFTLNGDDADVVDIRATAERMLSDASFAAQARLMACIIANAPGAYAGAAELERIAGVSVVQLQGVP